MSEEGNNCTMRRTVLNLVLRNAMVSAYLLLFFPKLAYAYLDPGSGSYMIQMLIAVSLGVAVVLRGSWQRIKGIIVGIFSKGKQGEDEST